MITILNRREIFVTYSLRECNAVCARLSNAGIPYRIRTHSHSSMNRGRTGSLGVNTDFACEYRVFVHKADYERATGLHRS